MGLNKENGMNSVDCEVVMYAVREIGKNVPHSKLTYFVDEAESWMGKNDELVIVRINEYIPKEIDDGRLCG